MEIENLNIDYDKIEALYLNKETSSYPKDIEIFEGKLGLISYIEDKVFNKSQYKIEPKPNIKNENGEEESKPIPLERFIRFKLDDKKKLKSNAKLVEWSDGSMSLFIGKKYFNISTQKLMNSRIGVKVNDDMSLVGLNIPKRMTASLTEEDEIKIKKFIEDDRSKVKISYTIKGTKEDNVKNKYLKNISYIKKMRERKRIKQRDLEFLQKRLEVQKYKLEELTSDVKGEEE